MIHGQLSRKLTALEEELEFYNQKLRSPNVATVLKIRCVLSTEIITAALHLLQQQHPFLQMNIVEREDGLYFAQEGNQSVPLRIVQKRSESCWQEILKEELNCKIDSRNTCLFRVTYITAPEDNVSELIFLVHHAICDGISFLNLCDTFLQYCAQIKQGQEIQVQPLAVMPPIESLLPIKNNLFFKLKRMWSRINLGLDLLIKKPRAIAKEFDTPIELQKNLVLHRTLDCSKTLQLIQVCKQEKTTVTAALNAAMLIALQRTFLLASDIHIIGIIAINLRRLIHSELASPRNLGCLVGFPFMVFHLPQLENFWNLARSCKQKIGDLLLKERPFQSPFLAKDRINLTKQKRQMPISFILSNLGRSTLQETYGDLELLEVRTTTSLRNYYPIIISHTSTFRDSLHITFSYVEPLVSSQKVEELLDCFISVINRELSVAG